MPASVFSCDSSVLIRSVWVSAGVYDPATGKLAKPCTGTPQGLSADSTWARGQAWGIYGWTLAYRYTQDKSYLAFAEKVAAFYLAAVRTTMAQPI